MTTSFPFEHFKTILEYGDSHLSSQFSSVARNISHKCHIHLLRVDLKGNGALPLVLEASTSLVDLKYEEVMVFSTKYNLLNSTALCHW